MKRPHASDDVRERALATVEDGHRVVDVAVMYRVDPSTVRRWRRQQRRTGSCHTLSRAGRPRRIPRGSARSRGGLPGCDARRTLRAMAGDTRRGYQCAHNGAGAPSARAHAQKKTLIAREQDAVARAAWRSEMATVDPGRLIFRDETSTPTTLTPLRGRSPRGQRVVGRVPRGRWTAVTLLATLTASGFGPGLQVNGALDREAFDVFVPEGLVPTLRPGDVVVLDNLSVHQSLRARQAVEAAGARLVFLPPYSPDFNPIEQAFAKLKQGLRAAGARTTETVMAATQELYPRITATDARGYYHHAGYFL